METLKRCSACRQDLKRSAFGPDRNKPDRLNSRCRKCDNERSKAYYARNREKKLAYSNAYNAQRRAERPPRLCTECEKPSTSSKHRYCDECRPEATKRRRERSEHALKNDPERYREKNQRYGSRHRKMRLLAAEIVEQGGALCARCGFEIDPSEPWDLGHVDGDTSQYAGPEHAACNRATTRREDPQVKLDRRVWILHQKEQEKLRQRRLRAAELAADDQAKAERRAQRLRKAEEAAIMRQYGHKWQTIADILGYGSAGAAYNAAMNNGS